MPRLTEITVRVRRGLTGPAESTAAEVAATFQTQKGDGDLASMVEEKFHEVCRALNQALESEPQSSTPKPTNGSGRDDVPARVEEMEGNTGKEPCQRTEPLVEDSPPSSSSPAEDSGEPTGGEPNSIKDTEDAETELVTPTAQPASVSPSVSDAPPPDKQAEAEPSATAAQQRTIESLRRAASLDDGQLQALLETNFNRKAVRELTKREGASLILLLSRKQRERIVPDKPETGGLRSHPERKEVFSHNGSPS